MAEEIGPIIRSCRKALGITQEELAHSVGTRRETISQLECGLVPNVLTALENALSERVVDSRAAGRIDAAAAVALGSVQALEPAPLAVAA